MPYASNKENEACCLLLLISHVATIFTSNLVGESAQSIWNNFSNILIATSAKPSVSLIPKTLSFVWKIVARSTILWSYKLKKIICGMRKIIKKSSCGYFRARFRIYLPDLFWPLVWCRCLTRCRRRNIGEKQIRELLLYE